MEKIGKYQDDIQTLPILKISDYERIFKIYSETLDDKEFYYYNMLNKIDISDLDSEFLAYYDVKSKLPMTTISYNIYNDINMWWLIYILNKNLFIGPPFWINGGVQIKYLKPEYLSLLYLDITKNTILGGRHF
jgi:hypothetical protein